MFSKEDITQIHAKGISIDKVQEQLDLFKKGAPYANLISAATTANGITKYSSAEIQELVNFFEENKHQKKLLKFVPASGAATRMFKFLFEFLEEYDPEKESINAFVNKHKANQLSVFFAGVEKFPFYQRTLEATKNYYPDFKALSRDRRRLAFIKTMLEKDKLNYSAYPKGLLPFHQYNNHSSTAFSEHLFEASLYASNDRNAKLHFTISPIHLEKFEDEFKRIQDIVEHKTNTTFEISFSYQEEATDTIAVTPDNKPFRTDEGKLLFRPSGHGALLQNLNALDADIIFIKNVDNVVVSHLEEEVSEYKKMLAGALLQLQKKVFQWLTKLENDDEVNYEDVIHFLKSQLHVNINVDFEKYTPTFQKTYLQQKLNRPIRICGMVKNEGEPGGGPFWVKNQDGVISLQIVESAQINKKNKKQKDILKNASHFNPVDIVCGIRNYKGEKFDLAKFVDHQAVFISNKTNSGKSLKALELPGLWNGSMAHWNTIFVEVPLITFNPVKTVNDLLKSSHQI